MEITKQLPNTKLCQCLHKTQMKAVFIWAFLPFG